MKENQIKTVCPKCKSQYIIEKDKSGLHYICPQCSYKIPLYNKFIELSAKNYSKTIEDNTGVLIIVFVADWSQPSKNYDIPMKKIANQYYNKIRIAVYDIAESEEHAKELKIFSIPTILIFKDQNQKERLEGFFSAEELSIYIERHLS